MTRREDALISALVAAYERQRPQIALFMKQLLLALSSAPELAQHVHSFKSRLKDSEHLRDKLVRKLVRCRAEGQRFDINPENLLIKVNDLAGVRILHLYTRQIRNIDRALRDIFQESQYELLEGPFARTWDDESRDFFSKCGIDTQVSPSLYTSVHYVIGSASRTKVTAEIQVRTLMEEVWGEVDHTINYPQKTTSLACAEQLKVLARITSGATRLVDSIFVTLEDHTRVAPPVSSTSTGQPPRSRQKKMPAIHQSNRPSGVSARRPSTRRTARLGSQRSRRPGR
jgi:ppGpp synthetase/RelA/SpoT-type nucleotidyltranferase